MLALGKAPCHSLASLMDRHAQDTSLPELGKLKIAKFQAWRLIINVLVNWQVNNPFILPNYSSGYKLLVNHSILSNIPFKKMSLLLELRVLFLQQKHCLHSLTKRCTWNEGQGGSLVKSEIPGPPSGCSPLEASRWRSWPSVLIVV